MTEPRDSDSEMPTSPFPWPTRPDAHAVDALLAGTCQPEEAPAELRTVAEGFAALVQAGLVFASAALIAQQAVSDLMHPKPIQDGGWALAVMGVSIALTGALIFAQS